ncbi:MAG: hypothetical protein JJT95_02455 [Pararhodobacter sp.]|nr:hypothetical protein [Pararhodobacter sp.]
MRSNGFGSFIQEIVVHVPRAHAAEVSEILGVEPFVHDLPSGRSYFRVERHSTRRGDDESVVYDLQLDLPFSLGWRVDWEQSQY